MFIIFYVVIQEDSFLFFLLLRNENVSQNEIRHTWVEFFIFFVLFLFSSGAFSLLLFLFRLVLLLLLLVFVFWCKIAFEVKFKQFFYFFLFYSILLIFYFCFSCQMFEFFMCSFLSMRCVNGKQLHYFYFLPAKISSLARRMSV